MDYYFLFFYFICFGFWVGGYGMVCFCVEFDEDGKMVIFVIWKNGLKVSKLNQMVRLPVCQFVRMLVSMFLTHTHTYS